MAFTELVAQAGRALAVNSSSLGTHLGGGGDGRPLAVHIQHRLFVGAQAGQALVALQLGLVVAEAQQQRLGAQPGHLQAGRQGGK